MTRIFIIISFFFVLLTAKCQTKSHFVIDKSTSKPISFVSVKVLHKEEGFYTDRNGLLKIPSKFNKDTLVFKHISFKAKKIAVVDVDKDIVLEAKENQLAAVVIPQTKYKLKEVGLHRKRKNLSWHISRKQELAVFVKYLGFENAIIKNIKIPISKTTIIKKGDSYKMIKPKFNTAFKLKIYSVKNNLPDKLLTIKPVIVFCNEKSAKILTVDVADNDIVLTKEGVFVSVEMLGELNENGGFISKKEFKSLPSFKFTKKEKENIKSKSYIKSFFNDDKWKDLNDYNDYNFAIGMTLAIKK